MICKISALFQESQLIIVEDLLRSEGIKRFTVFQVQGRGEFANMIDNHYLSTYYQLDIYIGQHHVTHLIDRLLEELHLSGEDEGVISVVPVSQLFSVNTKMQINDPEYNRIG